MGRASSLSAIGTDTIVETTVWSSPTGIVDLLFRVFAPTPTVVVAQQPTMVVSQPTVVVTQPPPVVAQPMVQVIPPAPMTMQPVVIVTPPPGRPYYYTQPVYYAPRPRYRPMPPRPPRPVPRPRAAAVFYPDGTMSGSPQRNGVSIRRITGLPPRRDDRITPAEPQFFERPESTTWPPLRVEAGGPTVRAGRPFAA